MTASDDRLAVVLLCTSVGKSRGSELPLIGPVGWAEIQKRLGQLGRRPGDLLTAGPQSLEGEFGFSTEQSDRIAMLIRRAGPVAIELERLADRGFWSMTQTDDDYPSRLRLVLESSAPPVVFGAGSRALLGSDGLAIVGSRDADPEALRFARDVATAAVAGGLTVVSGGARGVDLEASRGAIDAGGMSVVVAPEQLERRVREPSVRDAIADEHLVVVSPYAPGAGFSVRGAMGRNRIVYALSIAAVVADAKLQQGGTWAGASEALKWGKLPVFVRPMATAWARGLMNQGARTLPWSDPLKPLSRSDISAYALAASDDVTTQGTLFDEPPPTQS